MHKSHVQDLFSYFDEGERLTSFEGWPVTFLSARTMAAAGFYFLKREDIVRCAFCGVEVGSWVEGDDPMQDHERWSPSCRFVRKIPVGNIPIDQLPKGISKRKKTGSTRVEVCGPWKQDCVPTRCGPSGNQKMEKT